jgi:hypothetical protein
MKCNETLGKWYKNKHGASKIIDTLETYQPLVTSLGHMLKSVERFMQPTDVVRMRQVEKTKRMLTIDLLIESAMKEVILDVELVNRLGVRNSNAEDDTDGLWLDDMTESLV